MYCCYADIFCLSSLFFFLPPVYPLKILGLVSLANAGLLVFYRKRMGKREENREFFVDGLNMETEREREGKERKNRKILGGFLFGFTGL